MKISSLQPSLEQLLYEGCIKYIQAFEPEQEEEKIYAFVIHCESAFRSMSPAVSTDKSLARHKRELSEMGITTNDNYLEVFVAEWAYPGLHYEHFRPVTELIDRFYEILYGEAEENESQFEDREIITDADYENVLNTARNSFVEAIVRTLDRLRAEGLFDGALFEKSILLGLQFSDPDASDRALMVHASSRLNSNYWHNKILMLQQYWDSIIDA